MFLVIGFQRLLNISLFGHGGIWLGFQPGPCWKTADLEQSKLPKNKATSENESKRSWAQGLECVL